MHRYGFSDDQLQNSRAIHSPSSARLSISVVRSGVKATRATLRTMMREATTPTTREARRTGFGSSPPPPPRELRHGLN